MFQTYVLMKNETHILCSVTFFFFLNHVVYEIMWKNAVEVGRRQITIWHVLIAGWVPKATIHTHVV
jgi:hypothetical protein